MEPFDISSSPKQSCQKSYDFTQAEGSPLEDDVELPLPPGTSGDDFLLPLSPKQQFLPNSNNIFPFLPQNKASKSPTSSMNHVLVPENLNILTLQDDSQLRSNFEPEEYQEEVKNTPAEFLDDNKYSPSKVDSDEENQDFVISKPKVLGKEQAKRRLMAFSLSKQPSVSIKKQSKAVTSVKNKEKPPNPNKGSNVQEQFRATISAIEEEKKKMFQNMPSYLLLEMSELAKSSHTSMSTSLQVLEKLKNENADSKNKSYNKNGNLLSEKSKSKKSYRKHRSRSRSGSKNKKRSRSRSRSRSKISRSRNRKRNRSRSHSSASRNRRPKEELSFKSEKIFRENQSVSTKKLVENWSSFKSTGLVLESESELSKKRFEDLKVHPYEYSKRPRSPNLRPEFKPVFSYLSKSCRPMVSFQAKPADPGNSFSVTFSEKTIKYTRVKPTICWAENPSRATEFYMSKQMLLENCDEAAYTILICIIENKRVVPLEKDERTESTESTEERIAKNRAWYPHESCFLSDLLKTYEDLEFGSNVLKKSVDIDNKAGEEIFDLSIEDKDEINSDDGSKQIGRTSPEKKISLVNDSYLSDEEEQVKEMMMGDVKVQLDLDLNSVKVRSKWDSDYEGENSEKELNSNKEKKVTEPKIEDSSTESKEKVTHDFDITPCQPKQIPEDSTEGKKSSSLNLSKLNLPYAESPNLDVSDGTTGNLVSEYEEFLKMVSVESSDHQDIEKKEIDEPKGKTDLQKVKKLEKSSEEKQEVQTSKFALTEWDQESDHEEKSNSKKMRFTGSNDEFLILGKSERSDVKLEKDKRKPSKKKIEKFKSMKKKLLKNISKEKKKKFEETCSEESTSELYETNSNSDSDENISSKKKKKKKMSKNKKKNKKDSSSGSSSDSDDSKRRKKKSKNKKGGKKRSSSSESSSEGGTQNTLLKQLDFKKQLIIKKIEEIDSISGKTSKKKEKDNRGKKKERESSEETDSNKPRKSEKKIIAGKIDKKKFKVSNKKSKVLEKNKKLKKSKSSSESDSESNEKDVKKKKAKKEKRKRDSSNSSESEEKPTKVRSKSLNKSFKKTLKIKKGSSSSSSYDSVDLPNDQKKIKNKEIKVKIDDENSNKITQPCLTENLLLDVSNTNSEEPSEWERKKLWEKSDEKIKKEDDDWETSSSDEACEHENKPRENSWDEDSEIREVKDEVPEDNLAKMEKGKNVTITEKEFSENNSTNTSETNHFLASETLKTSFSNFSFNENSFCSFGQELSRDFFLAERSYSNSGNIISDENLRTTLIEARPFQSVSKDLEIKKPADSELYSPGYSDSELSDTEIYKPEKTTGSCIAQNGTRKDIYDPLNCDSEGSVENKEIELSSIPLPCVSDILLPGESKNFENLGVIASSEDSVLRNAPHCETTISVSKLTSTTSPVKSSFTSVDFTPVFSSRFSSNEEKITPTKRQLMSVKGQQKLISKAASVFQDESDEENLEPLNKTEIVGNTQSDISEKLKEKILNENESEKVEEEHYPIERSCSKSSRDRSRERSRDREKRKRNRSRERRSSSKFLNKKTASPAGVKRSKTPEISREKREIRSDSFEIEPLKSSIESDELSHVVRPIPVLMGVEASSNEAFWTRPLVLGSEFSHGSDNLINHAESFDIYPSEESKYGSRNYDKEYEDYERTSGEKSRDGKNKKERRKSRSRSRSPKKKFRSKSPERRKSSRSGSPRRKSVSPSNRNKSLYSPKRRSPRRKSPSRRYKSSRSPDHKRSTSRSPKKRRGSPSRLSRSLSPRKYWSPKRRDESPRIKDSPLKSFSPEDRFSPEKGVEYSQPYINGLQNRIPVIGTSNEGIEMELNPSSIHSSFDDHLSFHRQMPGSSMTEADMYNSFYESQYADEFGVSGYSEEVGVNNLITVKSHEIEKGNSPERLSLDQRIEMELCASMTGSQVQSDQYQMQNQVCPSFQEINSNHFQNSYNCENTSLSNDNFYSNQNLQINSDYNEQYFNGHQQQPSPNYGSFQQYSNSQPVQNSMLQVGNIVEVVPALQHPPPPPPPLPSKSPQIMQVGNVLQVVPSQKATLSVPLMSHNYGLPDISPIVKTQKAMAVVAPSSIVPTPNPEAVLNPLIKAIQLEREKRKKEKEKRKAEREARRKARQLRREAKLMSVNEKLKKSVQNEGLMLGQEVEDDELLDGSDVPSPPIPVEIITFSSPSALPPAGKGILITAGFMPKPPSEKKEVKFADGICPGEGTSTSGGEDVASPPPKPKLPKEKRFKKKKTKVKKKVKVQIIRQIIQEEDDDEDDLSPPPPPPGDPPPVFFAKYPFGGDAQFPVYQTQTTTTTTLTTVQYPAQSFE